MPGFPFGLDLSSIHCAVGQVWLQVSLVGEGSEQAPVSISSIFSLYFIKDENRGT